MKIVIAPDSFKGSLSAKEISLFIARGIEKVDSYNNIILNPIADGGEGTVEALVESTSGTYHNEIVKDPLMRDIQASYGISGDGKMAVIEVAAASGITLLKEDEKNPLVTTSFGTGQLVKSALDKGCREFIIGLGGSVTNDAGFGMIKALGGMFLDFEKKDIGNGGGALDNLSLIDLESLDSRIKDSTFIAATDVTNPLCGPNGASRVYGPQKGAGEKMVKLLDNNLNHFANVVKQQLGIDILNLPGAGAAGGIGAGVFTFLNAELKSGVDIVLNYSKLEEKIKDADLVITGEGKMDRQSLNGKAPVGVAKLCKKYSVPVVALVGLVEDEKELKESGFFHEIYSLTSDKITKEEAIKNASLLVKLKAEEIIKNFSAKKV